MVGLGGLFRQDREGRQSVVTFHDRRLRAEAADGMGIQGPCRFRHGVGVRIDQQCTAWRRFIVFGSGAPQMEFRNRFRRKLVDEAIRVVSHVVAAEMDVADIAQKATAGRVHQCVQKLELGHRRRRQRDVRGGILNDVRASQDVLNFREMRDHHAKRLRRVRQRQEIVQIRAAHRGPCEVSRHEEWIQPIDQRPKARQVLTVNTVGAPDGDADRVNRDRIIACEIRQQLESVWIGEKILRVNLEPSDGRVSGHHLRNVRKPKADTGPFSRVWSGVTGDGHVPSPRYFG